jgi:hypothetical protein
VRFWSCGKFCEVAIQLIIVARVYRSESLRADKAGRLAHNVEVLSRVCSRREVEALSVRMKLKQLTRRRDRDPAGPCLVDLFDDVERSVLDRVKSDRKELHASE